MSHRRLVLAWGAVFALVLGGCAGGGSRPASPQPERPSVLLIVVDTLRRDHLGCYGYARNTSPNIDRLAAEAVRYEHAISQAPWTTPSIGSLLTSQYPGVLGIDDVASILDDEWVVLPEVLRDHGYATGGAVSHSYCSTEWNFAQGFDFFDESNILDEVQPTSPGVTREALRFLDNHKGNPFFLFLHYFDPHDAYVDQPGFVFPEGDGRSAPATRPITSSMLRHAPDDPTREEIAEIVRVYDSEIAFTDHHIGVVLDRLRELGLYDDMLIVFTADHGEEFHEHGRFRHAYTLYDELIRVPLIIKYPGRGAETARDTVALLDIYPTVLDVAGISVDHELEGITLARPAAVGDGRARTVFSETTRKKRNPLRAAVTRESKLILEVDTAELEYYELVTDPDEQNNLAKRDPERYASLLESLQDWLGLVNARRREATRIELTPQQEERLRSLGYLE